MQMKYLPSTILLAALLALLAPLAPVTRVVTSASVQLNAPAHSGSPLRTGATTRVETDWGKMPLYFITNQGQMDARVAYYVQGGDKTLYFTPDGITFALSSAESRWILKLNFVDAN